MLLEETGEVVLDQSRSQPSYKAAGPDSGSLNAMSTMQTARRLSPPVELALAPVHMDGEIPVVPAAWCQYRRVLSTRKWNCPLWSVLGQESVSDSSAQQEEYQYHDSRENDSNWPVR